MPLRLLPRGQFWSRRKSRLLLDAVDDGREQATHLTIRCVGGVLVAGSTTGPSGSVRDMNVHELLGRSSGHRRPTLDQIMAVPGLDVVGGSVRDGPTRLIRARYYT